MASVTTGFDRGWGMSAVCESVERKRRAYGPAVLERVFRAGVAYLALTQLFALLMSMTTVALRMARHRGIRAAHRVAGFALRRLRSGRHLRLIHMIAVRETFTIFHRAANAELFQTSREVDEFRVRHQLDRAGRVASYAQLALSLRRRGQYFEVAAVAGIVAGKDRRTALFIRSFMAEHARLLFMLGAIVIERR